MEHCMLHHGCQGQLSSAQLSSAHFARFLFESFRDLSLTISRIYKFDSNCDSSKKCFGCIVQLKVAFAIDAANYIRDISKSSISNN